MASPRRSPAQPASTAPAARTGTSRSAASGPQMVHPAARPLWRPDRSLQLELGDRGVVVDGAAAQAVRTLLAARGGRTAATRTRPAPPPGAAPVLRALREAGYLWPAKRAGDAEDDRLAPPSPRLAGELRALSVRHGERAAELLAARRQLLVVVHGAGRAGPLVASLLAAAGVGRIFVRDGRPTRLHQAAPGGIAPGDEGRGFATAAADAVQRAAPEAEVGLPLPGERPGLVVLARDEPVDPDHRAMLHAEGHAHLCVRLAADHGVVGPLVVPGLTSCLRCADLHRLDRDPAWTALAVQLASTPRAGPASPVTLAATLAGIAATQALAYLDGEQPAVVEGTLEQHLPDWRIRRRSWPIHPDCDCCATMDQ